MIMAAVLLLMLASADELYRRGVEAFQSGRHDAAIESLAQAAKLAPKNAQIWKVLGVVHASREDYERAAEPFERACKLAPNLVDACYFEGRNLYALNRFEPALASLRKALPTDRRPWRVHLGIAQALEALGRAGESEPQFLAAVRLYESAPETQRGSADFDPRLHYAVFLFRQGRIQEALKPAHAATATHPNSGRARFELGRLLYQEGDLRESASELEKAVSLGFGQAARLMLGKVYLRLGRTEDARKQLDRARDNR